MPICDRKLVNGPPASGVSKVMQVLCEVTMLDYLVDSRQERLATLLGILPKYLVE